MVNPSPMRVPGIGDPRAAKVEVTPAERAPEEGAPEQPGLHARAKDTPRVAEVSPAGPRKLVRPDLPPNILTPRKVIGHTPLGSGTLHVGGIEQLPFPQRTSHAETFYLQKQAQSQTLMVFVLDDGEHIEGYIEWYDRNAIKVRHGSRRNLIYKSCIKYLYKAGEAASSF
jgi:sRNA-binding regulator protein Hfq